MLEMKSACENCNKPLPSDSSTAMICSYECTFCTDCATGELQGICPNCGGGFSPRPLRARRSTAKRAAPERSESATGLDCAFYYSPGSRYSYLALSQLPGLEALFGVTFDWIPVIGSRIRKIRGVDPFAGPPQSGQYNWDYRQRDAQAWANLYGIAFIEPVSHVFDSQLLGQGAVVAKHMDCVREYSWALASQVFGHGTWPLDEAVVIAAAEQVGLSTAEFTSDLRDPATAREIERNCVEAVTAGVFGTPTLRIEDRLFWGNDRLPLARHYLRVIAPEERA